MDQLVKSEAEKKGMEINGVEDLAKQMAYTLMGLESDSKLFLFCFHILLTHKPFCDLLV